ncbi:MAG: DJ-1/PfpI family protein [Deltaproteobacteria bacterium]|nr:DJ-1/PfpI family protein [Deltaproteobacteria bacterium]
MSRAALVLLPPGFSESELGVTLGVLRAGGFTVATAGVGQQPVRGEGGLTVLPDLGLDGLSRYGMEALIIPGFTTLDSVYSEPSWDVAIREVGSRPEVTVAAISAGVYLVARAGIMGSARWTAPWSAADCRALGVFREAWRQEASLVRDGRFITALGWAHLEFAFALGDALQIPYRREQFTTRG